MSRFSIVVIIGLGALSLVTSGCAGELTDEQKEGRRDGGGGSGVGGGGGMGGGTGGATGGGTGGSGGSAGSAGSGTGNPEVCMLAMTKAQNCGIVGCHGGNSPSAKLLLTDDALRQAKDTLVDKTNQGAMPGCTAGTH